MDKREKFRNTALYRILEYMFIHGIEISTKINEVRIEVTATNVWMSDRRIQHYHGILAHTEPGDRGFIKVVTTILDHKDKNLYEDVLQHCQELCRDHQRSLTEGTKPPEEINVWPED